MSFPHILLGPGARAVRPNANPYDGSDIRAPTGLQPVLLEQLSLIWAQRHDRRAVLRMGCGTVAGFPEEGITGDGKECSTGVTSTGSSATER